MREILPVGKLDKVRNKERRKSMEQGPFKK